MIKNSWKAKILWLHVLSIAVAFELEEEVMNLKLLIFIIKNVNDNLK